MPDITMCSNTDCYIADFCYRATAVVGPYFQSWDCFAPKEFPIGTWTCEHFIPIYTKDDFKQDIKQEKT